MPRDVTMFTTTINIDHFLIIASVSQCHVNNKYIFSDIIIAVPKLLTHKLILYPFPMCVTGTSSCMNLVLYTLHKNII